jgi:hypothetical protein
MGVEASGRRRENGCDDRRAGGGGAVVQAEVVAECAVGANASGGHVDEPGVLAVEGRDVHVGVGLTPVERVGGGGGHDPWGGRQAHDGAEAARWPLGKEQVRNLHLHVEAEEPDSISRNSIL